MLIGVECESMTLSVNGNSGISNKLTVNGLDIEYHSDLISIMMSPFMGYQLLNAMALDFEFMEYPSISVHILQSR